MAATEIQRKDYAQPAANAASVTPDDSNELTFLSRALYVGGTGNVKVTMKDGAEVTFSAISSSTILPIAVRKVHSTGTTATAIIALW